MDSIHQTQVNYFYAFELYASTAKNTGCCSCRRFYEDSTAKFSRFSNEKLPNFFTCYKALFNASQIHCSTDPQHIIAFGAATQAATLVGNLDNRVQDILLLDVTPLSLGVATTNGKQIGHLMFSASHNLIQEINQITIFSV